MMKRRNKILIGMIMLGIFLSSCSSTQIKEEPRIDIVIEDVKPVEKSELPEEIIIPQPPVEKLAIEKFAESKIMKYGNISFYAVDLENGETVESYRENTGLVPASVMKIVTSAAALEVMGGEKTFKTKLVYDGNINSEGVLQGDLYIIGEGDPTLGSDGIEKSPTAFIYQWLNEMKKLGIKSVTGDLIVMDGKFGYEGVSGKWLWEDMGTAYAQGTYGISIFDNLYSLHLKSGGVGTKPEIISVKPEVKGMTFDNQARVSDRRKISVRGVPFENKRTIIGVVPQNSNIVLKSDIPDPGLFMGQYFAEAMKNAGITLKGKITTERVSAKRAAAPKTIAMTESATVEEMVKVLLERSDNHYTEHLFQLLKSDYNTDIEKFWKSKGIDVSALIMRDGSGLSRGDTLSAKILVDILVYMDNNTDSQFSQLLPITGEKGTVADFMKNTGVIARIKSGSMSGIQSYTGYLEKDGKRYAFAIIVNHWNGSRNQLKREMEKLLIEMVNKNI